MSSSCIEGFTCGGCHFIFTLISPLPRKVLEGLKSYGIENIEEIHLPNDPQKEGKIRGFALLEFSTHSNALAAFQRLRKPDAVFGCDRSAKVAFAQTPMHPNEEVLSQVRNLILLLLTERYNFLKICYCLGASKEWEGLLFAK